MLKKQNEEGLFMRKRIIPYVALVCLLTACTPQTSSETATGTVTSTKETDITSAGESETEAEVNGYEYNFLYARAVDKHIEGYDKIAFFFEIKCNDPLGGFSVVGREFSTDGDYDVILDAGGDVWDGASNFHYFYISKGTSSKGYLAYSVEQGWETLTLTMGDEAYVVHKSDLVDEGFVSTKFRSEYEASTDNVSEDNVFTCDRTSDEADCTVEYRGYELIDSIEYVDDAGETHIRTASYDKNKIVKFNFYISAPDYDNGNYPNDSLDFYLYADGEECEDLGYDCLDGYREWNRSFMPFYNGQTVSMYYEFPEDTRALELISEISDSDTRGDKILIRFDE
jgi:hypothetical protein